MFYRSICLLLTNESMRPLVPIDVKNGSSFMKQSTGSLHVSFLYAEMIHGSDSWFMIIVRLNRSKSLVVTTHCLKRTKKVSVQNLSVEIN